MASVDVPVAKGGLRERFCAVDHERGLLAGIRIGGQGVQDRRPFCGAPQDDEDLRQILGGVIGEGRERQALCEAHDGAIARQRVSKIVGLRRQQAFVEMEHDRTLGELVARSREGFEDGAGGREARCCSTIWPCMSAVPSRSSSDRRPSARSAVRAARRAGSAWSICRARA